MAAQDKAEFRGFGASVAAPRRADVSIRPGKPQGMRIFYSWVMTMARIVCALNLFNPWALLRGYCDEPVQRESQWGSSRPALASRNEICVQARMHR
jgi:hypothetical protein